MFASKSLFVNAAAAMAILAMAASVSALPSEQDVFEPAAKAVDERTALAKSFKQRYSQKGKPKMAVYFNRQLSPDVREWASNSRIAIAFQGVATGLSQEQAADGFVTGEHQTKLRKNVKRIPPFARESWVWRLESGINKHMRRAGAVLVDQRVPERHESINKANQDQFGNVNEKEIEMKALGKSANILVELLLDNPASGSSLTVSAQATSTKSGEIVASFINSYEFNDKGELVFIDDEGEEIELSNKKKEYEATDNGYKLKAPRPEVALNLVAKHIAASLQGEMVAVWR